MVNHDKNNILSPPPFYFAALGNKNSKARRGVVDGPNVHPFVQLAHPK